MTRGDDLVIALMFIPKSGVVIHFINKTLTLNADVKPIHVFIDRTLGYLSQYNTYYKIAEFTLDDLKDYDHPNGMSYLLKEMKMNVLDAIGLDYKKDTESI